MYQPLTKYVAHISTSSLIVFYSGYFQVSMHGSSQDLHMVELYPHSAVEIQHGLSSASPRLSSKPTLQYTLACHLHSPQEAAECGL